jgi:DNA-binding beta-propeller fold protein YncE
VSVASALIFAASAAANQRAYFSDFDGTDGVAGFDLAAGGGLGPAIAGSPFATGALSLEGLAIAPNGQHLYAAGENANLFAFSISGTGALAPVSGSPYTTPGSYGVVATPDNRLVYIANTSGDVISGYAAGPPLTPVTGSPVAVTGPRGLAIPADGKHLYVTRGTALSVYAIGNDGSLTEISGSPYASTADPYALNITPDGKYLYIGDRANNRVLGFAIAADGALTALGGGPYPTGDNPFGMTIAPDGKHLYTTDYDGASVTGYTIGSDGSLSAIPGSSVTVADNPAAATVNAAGTRLYVGNGGRDEVDVFSIAADGALTAIAGSPFSTGVSGDFEAVALTPAQPPSAAFTVTGGKQKTFNASASTDPDGTIARYDWDFGDGQTLADGGPNPTHTYSAGVYEAKLTLTDSDGCSAAFVTVGQTPYCSGSASATSSSTVDAKPPKLKLSGAKTQELGKPVKVKVSCDEACSVKATGKLTVSGSPENAKKPLKLKPAKAKLAAGQRKTLKLKLSGKARKAAKAAAKGKAKLTVTATDDAGNGAKAKRNVKLH